MDLDTPDTAVSPAARSAGADRHERGRIGAPAAEPGPGLERQLPAGGGSSPPAGPAAGAPSVTLNGVPIDVLAARLGTTRGALYKTLHDARRKLRAHLDERGTPLGSWLEETT